MDGPEGKINTTGPHDTGKDFVTFADEDNILERVLRAARQGRASWGEYHVEDKRITLYPSEKSLLGEHNTLRGAQHALGVFMRLSEGFKVALGKREKK